MTPSSLLSHVTSSSVTNFTRNDIYEYLLSLGKINSLGYVGNMTCGIFLCIIGILGCFGNGLVIMVFLKSAALLKKPYNILLLNMAIADILVMGTAYPFSTLSAFYGRYIFSATVCVYQGYATFLSALTAMYTLVFLSVFRYVAVCIPQLKHRLSSSLTKRCLCFIWAYSIFWTTQPLFGWNRYTLERFGTSCSLDWSSKESTDRLYVMFLIVFCYLFPVSVMCFCYFRILLSALLMQHMRTRLLNIEEPKLLHRASLEVRISGMCFIMAFFYTVVWSPYAVVSVLTMYDVVPLWAYTLPTMFAKMASMLNPFIYVLTSSQFRANLRNTIFSFRNSRVLPIKEVSGMSHRHAGVYLVDRTKEGVFIGSQKATHCQRRKYEQERLITERYKLACMLLMVSVHLQRSQLTAHNYGPQGSQVIVHNDGPQRSQRTAHNYEPQRSQHIARDNGHKDLSTSLQIMGYKDLSTLRETIGHKDLSTLRAIMGHKDLSSLLTIMGHKDLSTLLIIMSHKDLSTSLQIMGHKDLSTLLAIMGHKDLSTLRAIMGHKDLSTLLPIMGHIDISKLQTILGHKDLTHCS